MNSSTLPPAPKDQKPEFITVPIGLQAPVDDQVAHHAPLTPEVPYIYTESGAICIENQARLPVDRCILTNETTATTELVALRDPRNPGTWFGKRPKIRVGMSAAARKKLQMGELATWISFSLGAGLLSAGAIGMLAGMAASLASIFYLIGAGLCLAAGFFRANSTISAPRVGRKFTMIEGAHPDYLKHFDQFKDGELVKFA